jgi:hypothetical protein
MTSSWGRVGVVEAQRADAGLLAAGHLVAHIDCRGRIGADQDDRQTGLHAARGERSRTFGDFAAHLRGKRVAVDDASRHVIVRKAGEYHYR